MESNRPYGEFFHVRGGKMNNSRYKVLESALHDSFVAEAIALKTGMDRIQVHNSISELISDAFIGQAVQRSSPETAALIADIAERMLDE